MRKSGLDIPRGAHCCIAIPQNTVLRLPAKIRHTAVPNRQLFESNSVNYFRREACPQFLVSAAVRLLGVRVSTFSADTRTFLARKGHDPRKLARDRLDLRVFVPSEPFGSWERGLVPCMAFPLPYSSIV